MIPLFVTLGSPLAVTAISSALAPDRHPKGVERWFNAMDERDVVALYPRNDAFFPTNPAIENKTDNNATESRHGIEGHLADPVVATKINEALKA